MPAARYVNESEPVAPAFGVYVNAPVLGVRAIVPFVGAVVMENVVLGEVGVMSTPCKKPEMFPAGKLAAYEGGLFD